MMQFPIIQHRGGKGWEVVLRPNRKLTVTRTKLGLSATPLGETEGHVVQSAHFQAIQNEFLESLLVYPVCRSTVPLPVHS